MSLLQVFYLGQNELAALFSQGVQQGRGRATTGICRLKDCTMEWQTGWRPFRRRRWIVSICRWLIAVDRTGLQHGSHTMRSQVLEKVYKTVGWSRGHEC